METVGFIGLGEMGAPIAGCLMEAGFGLRVYNRTAAKAEKLVAAGATLVDRPEDTASEGGIVLSIVSDDPALQEVGGEALARCLGQGGIHISMSTVQPKTTESLAACYAAHGAAFVAAPVFGHPSTIGGKSLWVMLAGPEQAKARAMTILEPVAKGLQDLGERPQAANVAKLAGNFIGFSALEALTEASVLAEVNGIPRATLLKALTETLFSAPMYKRFAGQIVEADFSHAEFTAALALKDMGYARAAAGSGAKLPGLDVLCERFKVAVTKGHGSEDASVMALGAAEDAGLNW